MSDRHGLDQPGPVEEFDTDIHARAVFIGIVGLLAIIAVSMLLMWWLGAAFKADEVAEDPALSPLIEANGPQLPPLPRLQPAPVEPNSPELGPGPEEQLIEMRAEEARTLNSYGWENESEGVARIPIERAIELFVAQGGASTSPAGDPSSDEATEGEAAAEGNAGEESTTDG